MPQKSPVLTGHESRGRQESFVVLPGSGGVIVAGAMLAQEQYLTAREISPRRRWSSGHPVGGGVVRAQDHTVPRAVRERLLDPMMVMEVFDVAEPGNGSGDVGMDVGGAVR